jgi:hypothetical protein
MTTICEPAVTTYATEDLSPAVVFASQTRSVSFTD